MGPEAPREGITQMPPTKRILCPERLRSVPKAFSWVDHRLVRERHISRCSHEALALYLLLVTVADAEGLSYYSDPAVGRLLDMSASTLSSARADLCRVGLIAYRKPLYQVLSLDTPEAGLAVHSRRSPECSGGDAISIGEVLRKAIGGGS
jgi:hypothetical protein